MEEDTLRELYEYNRWANERMLTAVSRLTPEQYIRDMHSSHPSVRDTCVHLISCEWLYLQRIGGVSPKALWGPEDYPTSAKLRDRWLELPPQQMAIFLNLTEERLKEPLTYINLAGKPFTYPLWQILRHVVNHSSYHRGQVTTMLRQLGKVPESTDFLLYYDLHA